MTKKEKQEINQLPYNYIPMSGWDYLGWSFVYALPIFGFFFVLVNSLRTSNLARRSHARSFIVAFIVSALFVAVAGAVIYFTMGEMLEEYYYIIMDIIMEMIPA